MAVVQNVLTTSGDILYIKTDNAVVGLVALLSFLDSTSGETSNAFLYREFSYSYDDLIWSDYQQLTNANVANVPINPTRPFFVKYRYTRQGTDNTNPISWLSTDLLGNYGAGESDTYFTMSSFSCFFIESDPDVLGWYLNVTEKLYNSNLLAEFITKNLTGTFADRDFLDLWLSISKFFAYYVILARRITSISQSLDECDNLLVRYLEEMGLFVAGTETLDQLNNLRINLLAEFSKRGTWSVMNENDSTDNNNGELLRLIAYKTGNDEFLFNLFADQYAGWNIDNCSPLFTGLFSQINLNKAYEKTQFVSKAKYPIIDPANAAIVNSELQLTIANAANNGFRDTAKLFLIKVDPYLTYDFSFVVRNTAANIALDFGLDVYDKNGDAVTIHDASNTNILQYSLTATNIDKSGNNVLYRCIIYGFNHSSINVTESSLGNKNFKLQVNNFFISPIIKFTNNSGGSAVITINQIKILPAFTQYGRGFIGVKNLASIFLRNNSDNDEDTINDDIKRFLLPYNVSQAITFLNDLEISDTENAEEPAALTFLLNISMDWTGIVGGASYDITFTIFKDGNQLSPLEFTMLTSQLFPYNISQNSNYIVSFIQNYTGPLEYSLDQVNWITVNPNISTQIEQFICTGNQNIYIRKKQVLNSQVAIDNVVVYEGNVATFTLTRTGDLVGTQTINYTTQDGTADSGTNYTATSGTITFNPGETQKTIAVTTLNDGIPNEADRTFSVILSGPTNGLTVTPGGGVATLKDVNVNFNLDIYKDTFQGFAFATINKVSNPASSFAAENGNTSQSTIGIPIDNDVYTLSASILYNSSIATDIDVIEVQCENEKQYIQPPTNLLQNRTGTVTFQNQVKPDINGNITVYFRKCKYIGDESTATCQCDNVCLYGYMSLKVIGSGSLGYDVKIVDAVTSAILQEFNSTGNFDNTSTPVLIGNKSVNILITASDTGHTIRTSVWSASFFDEQYTANSASLTYNGKTTNVYIEIQEM